MKLHIVTIGEPKLAYAKAGFEEYVKRIGRYHQLRITHLADKYETDSSRIAQAAGNAYVVAMEISGQQFSSGELAATLEKLALEGRELCFLIGGPDGLPEDIRTKANARWSMSRLTYPHDLAMVMLAESLYRASTINAGQPYHR